MIGKNHDDAARNQTRGGNNQQTAHANVIEQRTADRDGEGEPQKDNTQCGRDHPSGVQFIDWIEEVSLQTAGNIAPDTETDTSRNQGQDTE